MAEARIRHAKRCHCLTAGEDHDIIMRSVRRGWADIDEALNETGFIVRSCWPEIMKLGIHMQTHRPDLPGNLEPVGLEELAVHLRRKQSTRLTARCVNHVQ